MDACSPAERLLRARIRRVVYGKKKARTHLYGRSELFTFQIINL
jgi:hypothetical protein